MRFILMSCFIALAAAGCAAMLPPVEAPTRDGNTGDGPPDMLALRASGNQIVDARGKRVVLRGVNRPGLELDLLGFRRFTEADIRLMAQRGANVIRLPINPVWYVAPEHEEYRAAVATVVRWAEHNTMYILLDQHWSTPEGLAICHPDMPLATAFWRAIAQDFSGRAGVLYDLYNEPCKMTWAEWAPMAETMIDAVRSVAPQALVLVPGVDWAYDLRGVRERPIARDNVVYSAHDYPWKTYLPREEAYGYLADTYPLVLGEFGADYLARYGFWADPVRWAQDLLAYADRRGLSGWIAWSWHIDTPPNLFLDWTYTPTPFGRVVLEALAGPAQQSEESSVDPPA